MKTISSVQEIQALTQKWRMAGHTIALVPTMGYFHEGHLSLMRYARKRADKVVVSLFVNPIQFGPKEDLASYPRNLQRDSEMAEGTGVDILFCPDAADMYPDGFQSQVSVGILSQGLCGASRPGHFTGVATVVSKLFHLTNPHIAIFGEKDYQQLAVIRQFVSDLNFPVEIVGHPIVREADGLAMSSRNTYLDAHERQIALCLSKALQSAKNRVQQARSPISTKDLADEARSQIESHRECLVDYIALVNSRTLQPVEYADRETLMALAVKINNKVRLIDNTLLCAE